MTEVTTNAVKVTTKRMKVNTNARQSVGRVQDGLHGAVMGTAVYAGGVAERRWTLELNPARPPLIHPGIRLSSALVAHCARTSRAPDGTETDALGEDSPLMVLLGPGAGAGE